MKLLYYEALNVINRFQFIRSSNQNIKRFVPLLMCKVIEVVIYFNDKNN